MMLDTNNLKKLSNHFNLQDCVECDINNKNVKTSKEWVKIFFNIFDLYFIS